MHTENRFGGNNTAGKKIESICISELLNFPVSYFMHVANGVRLHAARTQAQIPIC